jgi:alkylation response protein AidB-like acyl-CoA dehydrogenase
VHVDGVSMKLTRMLVSSPVPPTCSQAPICQIRDYAMPIRPIAQIVNPDHPDLNEVFFSDVVVPKDDLVGQLNNGWAMANGSLAYERGMVWLSGVLQLEREIDTLLAEAPAARLALRAAEMGTDRKVDIGSGPTNDGTWFEHDLVTLGATISAGTSEIQRNSIAENVLGPPR